MATRIKIEIDTVDLKALIVKYLSQDVGIEIEERDVTIIVKTKQNYRAEWEPGEFRAIVERVKESA